MRLGFIGLGSMGAAMARNLAGAGHDLTVYDLDPGLWGSITRSRLASVVGWDHP